MISGTSRGSVPSVIPAPVPAWRAALGRVLRHLEAAVAVAGERHRLGALDVRMLKDIGLGRSEADREATRRFLDVPEHRIRR